MRRLPYCQTRRACAPALRYLRVDSPAVLSRTCVSTFYGRGVLRHYANDALLPVPILVLRHQHPAFEAYGCEVRRIASEVLLPKSRCARRRSGPSSTTGNGSTAPSPPRRCAVHGPIWDSPSRLPPRERTRTRRRRVHRHRPGRSQRCGGHGRRVLRAPTRLCRPFAVLAILAWSSGDTGGDGCREAP